MVIQVEEMRFSSDFLNIRWMPSYRPSLMNLGGKRNCFKNVCRKSGTLEAAADNLETLELYCDTDSETESSSEIDALSDISPD